ncbi:response regulator with CheY-like receiver, AAA-type ATPase, and DNA-binding domains [Pyrinomonas methylaliphatogenes]|uniref:Response regulator with CheY-like receiver, AAA-type ATPase, and DNA-binding domains n=2 Tax=Pyrinomonas methylaliphatogenes TaxID=454194 RepID=A0A0B6X2S9_9BACT|nr:response regulator with CheY-like receiver, AAA-type ATPase, and DNA-binding domains [Pyrinomonas methylaliphatogenes]
MWIWARDGKGRMKPKVLIIDDDAAVSQQLFWVLCDEYEVLTANDLASALLLAREHKPQISILDLCLPPVVSTIEIGLYILEQLRNNLPSSQILVVSSIANPEIQRHCLQKGAFAVFKKPLDVEKLLQAVHRCARKKPTSASEH